MLEPVPPTCGHSAPTASFLQTFERAAVLDIGCGSFPDTFFPIPRFKKNSRWIQLPMPKETAAQNRIEFFTLDLNREPKLPFQDDFFSVVSLLRLWNI